ncbi:MAG: PadR family transcriptional regulator [Trueperaceae bacterium]
MSVKYGLLGLLARQAQHGYELKRSFEQFTGGFWELNHGQIYQSLERLAQDGLVSYTVESAENAPERKVYEVTSKGQQALDRWLERSNARVRPLRDELFVRLAVMAHKPPHQLRSLIADYRSTYSEHLRELTLTKRQSDAAAAAASGEPALEFEVEQMLLEAAIFHCEADLRWLDHCEAKLAARQRREAS